MKILIVNYSDIKGGAAKAAYRLHNALITNKIDSQMLVLSKNSDDYNVLEASSTMGKIINQGKIATEKIIQRWYYHDKNIALNIALLPSGKVVDIINSSDADIVHFHWINAGMLSIEDIGRLTKPIVWSLHDMWAFTGGCHYSDECDRYVNDCGRCKIINSEKENDLSKKIIGRKRAIFDNIENLTIVGLSRWMAECATNSALLKKRRVINLPNPINTKFFKKIDKKTARILWNLPKDKKLILFGAMSATSDSRKGYSELQEALTKLDSSNIELVIYGSSQPKKAPKFSFNVHYMGILSDEMSLVSLYSAVDVMIVPSLQENLSNAIMESLACGTPVAGFNIGGNSDMIEHKTNGYLAKPFDSLDLSSGIEWILNNKDYEELCKNARDKVLKEFESSVVAKKYTDLYKEILND